MRNFSKLLPNVIASLSDISLTFGSIDAYPHINVSTRMHFATSSGGAKSRLSSAAAGAIPFFCHRRVSARTSGSRGATRSVHAIGASRKTAHAFSESRCLLGGIAGDMS
jgi:hypothetical protein